VALILRLYPTNSDLTDLGVGPKNVNFKVPQGILMHTLGAELLLM
jgi:hypothetical protein